LSDFEDEEKKKDQTKKKKKKAETPKTATEFKSILTKIFFKVGR
jgi:hypothetical protein